MAGGTCIFIIIFSHKKTKAQLRCGNSIKECFFEKLILLHKGNTKDKDTYINIPSKEFQGLLRVHGISSSVPKDVYYEKTSLWPTVLPLLFPPKLFEYSYGEKFNY